ncbi:MAG TPA: YrhB domain-containing protein [Flavobacteriales bacterium]|mgnify:FL=1|nr:YrhB family protein [Flavobacteriales bacterium]MCC6653835.1 hypothetical protein [Flavobacteriales bacterium]HMZ47475.1 YrhB domain-containing protein [Flavobacteriales bacterium]HNE79319.1 YrhB domain-containing protein [Flavobacteriales bacterium]HNI04581.1 YrhB domain-containing protein [Flavobacteriales bacterium]
MITFEQARDIALAELARALPKYDFVLLDDETVTMPYGWIFWYNTRKYLETGDIMASTPGNAPFVVERSDGRIHYLPTGVPFPEALRKVERIIEAR